MFCIFCLVYSLGIWCVKVYNTQRFHIETIRLFTEFPPISLTFLCRSQLQGAVHVLPYMAAMRRPGADRPGGPEVTPLPVTSEAIAQTHRL